VGTHSTATLPHTCVNEGAQATLVSPCLGMYWVGTRSANPSRGVGKGGLWPCLALPLHPRSSMLLALLRRRCCGRALLSHASDALTVTALVPRWQRAGAHVWVSAMPFSLMRCSWRAGFMRCSCGTWTRHLSGARPVSSGRSAFTSIEYAFICYVRKSVKVQPTLSHKRHRW